MARENMVSPAVETLSWSTMVPPDRTDLLSQMRGQIWHPNPARLQLRVRPLQGLSHC